MNIEDLYRLLRNSHVQAQGIVDTLSDPLLVLDRGLCVQNVNRAFLQTFQVERDEVLGRPVYELGNGAWDAPEFRVLLGEVIPRSRAIIDYEVTRDFPGIGERTMLVNAHKLWHPDHNSTSLLMVFVDATTQHKRDADQEILVGELRHRMKNLLGVVQALARQTVTNGRTAEEYRDAFLGRVSALAKAHELDVSDSDGIELSELIEVTLAPYQTGSARIISAKGPIVSLSPAQSFPMSMILHELATNAAKHGALSSPGGQVNIVWELAGEKTDRRLKLRWEEEGGPPVAAASKQGFGTRLIDFATRHDLGGQAELSFTSTGLKAELEVPVK